MKFLLVLTLLSASAASAQSISPLLIESKPNKSGVAFGTLTLTNNTVTPEHVTLRPVSFSVDENGSVSARELDSSIIVQLSEQSSTIPAKSERAFNYTAKCVAPCFFIIYASFLPQRFTSGLGVQINLPSVVYVIGAPIRKDQIAVHLMEKEVVIENSGQNYGRALVSVWRNGKRTELGGFPIFGSYSRKIQLASPAERVEVALPGFKIRTEQ